MIIWIIGLSGSGKTTFAKSLYDDVKEIKPNTIYLDGDIVREIFDNDLGYSLTDRAINSKRIQKLCQLMDTEKVNVICSILSIFPNHREENRQIFKDYLEVFIDTPLADLEKRDSKGLYRRFNNGEIAGVVGKDIEFKRPEFSNLVIKNSGTLSNLLSYKKSLIKKIVG
jgi:adenylylsulfate kinase